MQSTFLKFDYFTTSPTQLQLGERVMFPLVANYRQSSFGSLFESRLGVVDLGDIRIVP
jgi:hypothetical protein